LYFSHVLRNFLFDTNARQRFGYLQCGIKKSKTFNLAQTPAKAAFCVFNFIQQKCPSGALAE